MTINLTIPQTTQELRPKITVVGVGGAGCNAVNNMINANLEGVEFLVMNTDGQSLSHSLAPRKIQLGSQITQGLGAGSKPEMGKLAAEESMEEVLAELNDCNMVFITAGMGGGTGTGAAPIIAKAAKDRGILTVGVVTKPFSFEGQRRMAQADEGISALQAYVDTLIVIPNQNLFRLANERTTFADAFNMADAVLHQGVCGVTDLMIKPGIINLDFADIRSVMTEMGKAMMGTGEATGENRAIEAAEAAINNPLLDDTTMQGAQALLINITGGMDMTLFEVDEAANRIRKEVDDDATIIFGSAFDEKLDGIIRVSVVATGFEAAEQTGSLPFTTAEPTPLNTMREPSPTPSLFSATLATEQAAETSSVTSFANQLSPPSASVTTKNEDKNSIMSEAENTASNHQDEKPALHNQEPISDENNMPSNLLNKLPEQNVKQDTPASFFSLGTQNYGGKPSDSISKNNTEPKIEMPSNASISEPASSAVSASSETHNEPAKSYIPGATEPMSPDASFAPVQQKTGLINRISKMWGVPNSTDTAQQKSAGASTIETPNGIMPSLSPLSQKLPEQKLPEQKLPEQSEGNNKLDLSSSSENSPQASRILDLPTISSSQADLALKKTAAIEDDDELDIPAFLRRQAN